MDFDEHIKKEAGAYQLQPRMEVWERVSHELDKKKDRKRFLWFWWLLPFTLAGTWGLFTLAEKEEKDFTPIQNESTSETFTPQATPYVHKEIVDYKESGQSNRRSETAILAKPFVALSTPFAGKPINQTNIMKGKTMVNSIDNNLLETGKSLNLDEGKKIKHEWVISTDTIAKEDKENLKTDDLATITMQESQQNIEGVKNSQKNENQGLPMHAPVLSHDSMALGKGVPKKREPQHKMQWSIVGGVGRHTYKQGFADTKLFGGGLQSADLSNAPTGPGGIPSFFNLPNPGTGFMIGIERTQDFKNHPRWQWQAGLHYQYQTVRVSTGDRKDSTISLENMGGAFSNNRSTFYYLPGATNTQTGFQHRTHFQAGIGWYLHQNKKWVLQGLAFGGIVLSADYLVVHSPQTGFVPIKQVLQKGYWGLESGIRFQPGKWGIGLYVQSNLSSSVANPAIKNHYWQGAECRVLYQFKTKK